MKKKIKETILESIRSSIEEAEEFMEEYKRRLVKGDYIINDKLDAEDYAWWVNYRKNLLEAYREILKMEVEK